jgi:peroxiredoxin
MGKLAVGAPAPDFTLPDDKGSMHALHAALERGPVVLIFYVLDNTPG